MSDLLDDGLWESVADLARRKGIARQSLHERVDRLAADGLISVRREGRTKLINVAEYDRAVGQVGDAFKEGAAETRSSIDSGDAPSSPALRDHQARAAQYTADLKFLDLEERLGRLVPVDEVKAGGIKIGEAVVSILGRLPTYAEGMAATAAKDGVQGVRGALKEIERELRIAIAKAISEIVRTAAPTSIEPHRDQETARNGETTML